MRYMTYQFISFHKNSLVSIESLVHIRRPWNVFCGVIICPQASQTCCDTPPFFGKDIPISKVLFTLRRGDGGDGLDNRWIHLGSLPNRKFPPGETSSVLVLARPPKKVLSSAVVCGVSQPSIVLRFMGGGKMGDESDSSGDWSYNSDNVHLL